MLSFLEDLVVNKQAPVTIRRRIKQDAQPCAPTKMEMDIWRACEEATMLELRNIYSNEGPIVLVLLVVRFTLASGNVLFVQKNTLGYFTSPERQHFRREWHLS